MPDSPPPRRTPLSDRTLTRRALLKRGTAGGLVVGGAAATYAVSKTAAKDGEVVLRVVGAVERDANGASVVDLFYRELDDDGPDEPRIHEALDGRLEGGSSLEDPYRVPDDLHRDLADRFEDLTYHVGHRCSGCSTPRVGRGTFNGLSLGERVDLLYLPGSTRAVRVP